MMCIGHWLGCVVVSCFSSYLDGEIMGSVLSMIVGVRIWTVSYKIASWCPLWPGVIRAGYI